MPSATDLTSFQNLLAGWFVAFDPFVEGSPACPGVCDLPADDTQLGLMQDVLAWDPTNTIIAHYVADFAATNNATQPTRPTMPSHCCRRAIQLLARQPAQVDTPLANINPELPVLFTNDGIITDPNYVARIRGPARRLTRRRYGGYDPYLVGTDLVTRSRQLTNKPTWTDLALWRPISPSNVEPWALLAGDPAAEKRPPTHRLVGGLQQPAGEPGVTAGSIAVDSR